ncbi:hypothetical protein L798_05059 [Zootermopsis nevadensis]|uniref:Uncharacterized protein n=1 Tax=Zootermopsis nevadensis TaxID=136037 RepID=A0A067RL61_ZOONE|nr:hypothetical protein L798_05059 [Zootermopsis nevadensis]
MSSSSMSVAFLWRMLVALFQEVYKLLATLGQQNEHRFHLAGCEGRAQCGPHLSPALT